MTSKN